MLAASLEVVDYENYLIIEEFVAHKEKVLLNRKLVQENIELCFKKGGYRCIITRRKVETVGKDIK